MRTFILTFALACMSIVSLNARENSIESLPEIEGTYMEEVLQQNILVTSSVLDKDFMMTNFLLENQKELIQIYEGEYKWDGKIKTTKNLVLNLGDAILYASPELAQAPVQVQSGASVTLSGAFGGIDACLQKECGAAKRLRGG